MTSTPLIWEEESVGVLVASRSYAHFRVRMMPGTNGKYHSRVNVSGYMWSPLGADGDVEQGKRECQAFADAVSSAIADAVSEERKLADRLERALADYMRYDGPVTKGNAEDALAAYNEARK